MHCLSASVGGIGRFLPAHFKTHSHTILIPTLQFCSLQGQVLADEGGKFVVSEWWIKQLCRSLNLSVRARTTAAQKLPDNWEELRNQMNQRVSVLQHKFNIPPVSMKGMGGTACPPDLFYELDCLLINIANTTKRMM